MAAASERSSGRAGQHDGGIVLARQAGRYLCEPIRVPLLDGASTARMNPNQLV